DCRVDPISALDAIVELPRSREIVRMQEPLPRAHVRLDLVFVVAEHLLPARRIDDGSCLEAPVPDAFLRAFERKRQPFLALAQRGFGPLARRDVEVSAADTNHR